MCKVFKIKTKTGLVTETTDQEIVKCLMDNYDGELTITVNKQSNDKKNELIYNGKTTVTFKTYTGSSISHFTTSLEKLIGCDFTEAVNMAKHGATLPASIQLIWLLKKHKQEYIINEV